MGAIESRLTRLERAHDPQDAPQWHVVEIRPVDGGLWRDAAGRTGTKDELTTQAAEGSIIVFLQGG